MVEVELSPFFKDTELDIPCFMGLAYCIILLMLEVGVHVLKTRMIVLLQSSPMQPCWLVISDINMALKNPRALSIADTVFCMQSQSMLHIYSALQGIESAALPTGEYLDILTVPVHSLALLG